MAAIKPCPICKTYPRISLRGRIWVAQCKLIVRQPHITVQIYNPYIDPGYEEIIKEWNKKVDEYGGDNHGTERKDS